MAKERKNGTILKGIGGFYYVACGQQVIECKASGRLRLGTAPPLAGDMVELEQADNGDGFIVTIKPRKNALIRPPIANIDQIFIVASQAPPVTDPYLIDKVTVIAQQQGIQPIIVLNKSDLVQSAVLEEAYRPTGFIVLHVSAATGAGCAELAELMHNKISCFTGNSGVGKSSLLSRLTGQDLLAGAISGKIGRGKNTTRHVELLYLPGGGLVADTPGFSSFEVRQMERIRKEDLQLFFPEIEPLVGRCRFTGCAHVKEPDCAVRALVQSGGMAKSRYESYVKLYEELKQMKDWQ